MAKNLARTSCHLDELKSVVINFIPFAIIATITMFQPDFGSVFLLFTITFLMLIAANLHCRYLIVIGLSAILSSTAAILLAPYRVARILSFLDPIKEAQRGGFQIIQSYMGFKNGGLFGQGLGESRQKLYFLPEAHTDFIISVMSEELGLLGILFFIFCLITIIRHSSIIISQQSSLYPKYLAFGLTSLIAVQASINMGVAMGVLPTKGMSLPFISSGSSSLIVFLASIGVICRIGRIEESNEPP